MERILYASVDTRQLEIDTLSCGLSESEINYSYGE